MQFVRNGPDLPEHLLQAHEDGCVEFFVVTNCGGLMEIVGKEAPPGRPEPPYFTSHHISACVASRVY